MGLYAQKPEALQLLETRCLGCHNAAGKQSGFDLSKRETALRGGDRGPGLVPGKAKESFLYQVLAHSAKPAMPKFGAKFTDAELALVAAWIDDGAPWEKVVTTGPKKSSHWAFNKPVRPAAATIDALLKTSGPEAAPDLLLRRLYLDLLGMPPTPEEIARHAKLSYEQTVDALLADSRYGERWAATGWTSGAIAIGTAIAVRTKSATATSTCGVGAIGSLSRSTPASRTTA